MEQVAVTIPARIYVTLYEHYGDQTSALIASWIEERAQSLGNGLAHDAGQQLRYPRPGSGTKTGRVWEIADAIEHEKGSASREDVIRACLHEGLNVNTASTQYSYWKSSRS